MKERFVMIFIFVFAFIIIVDIYSFKGLRLLVSDFESTILKTSIYILYWIIPVFIISMLLYFRSLQPFERDPKIFRNFFLIAGFFMLFYIPKLVFIAFHLIEDVVYLSKWIISKFTQSAGSTTAIENSGISRAKFITQLGLVLAAIPFTSIFYGMAKGRFNFRITNEKLFFLIFPKLLMVLK